MKKKTRVKYLLILLTAFLMIRAEGQEKDKILFEDFKNPEYFNRIANHKSKDLVFEFFQFNAPFRGSYGHTKLIETGEVSSVRVTPFARQNSRRTKLTALQIKEIKQKLSNFLSSGCLKNVPPQESKLYLVVNFNNDKSFLQCKYTGEIPNQLNEINDLLNGEFKKAEERFVKELEAKEKLAREKYGDWEKNPNLVRYASTGFSRLQNKYTVLLHLFGKQQPVTENSKEIPLYYALVLYRKGRIIGGAGGGTWSFEPLSRNGITWTSGNAYKPDKELVIEYSVINKAISIGNREFKLKNGNLFILELDKNWKLKIRQLNEFINERKNDREILSFFEKELGEKLSFIQQK